MYLAHSVFLVPDVSGFSRKHRDKLLCYMFVFCQDCFSEWIKASSFISLSFLLALYGSLHLYFRLIFLDFESVNPSAQIKITYNLLKKVSIFTSKILPLNPKTVRELHLNLNSKGSHIPAGFFFPLLWTVFPFMVQVLRALPLATDTE